jgi:hypothetical protein
VGFLGVVLLVVRGEVLGGDLLRQLEHGVEGVARVLGVAAPLGEQLDVEPLVEQELEVAPRQQGALHRVRVERAGTSAVRCWAVA